MRRILLISLLLSSFSLYSKEPTLKIDIGNGNYKTYYLSDIQNISLTNNNKDASLWIYFQKTKTISQEISGIDSIKFESNQTNFTNLVLYITGSTPKSCVLSEIDSIKIQYKLLSEFDTVKIGYQVWMTKNLDVDHYRNGDPIPQVTDPTQWGNLTTGAWCYYNNSDSLGKIYGKLYNWYAVNDPRGLAPEGWHIPTDQEWKETERFLGMSESEANKIGNRGTDEGGMLKESGTIHWSTPNTGATNSSGFTALPGSLRNSNGSFGIFGYDGFWWSMTEKTNSNALGRHLYSNFSYIYRTDYNKKFGFSVRCTKDLPPFIESVISSAKIGDDITIRGFRFGSTQGSNYVTFNGNKAINYTTWCDSLIVVRVPEESTDGKLFVIVNGMESNNIDFTIAPDSISVKIESISQTSFYIGDILTIKGKGFLSSYEDLDVYFNDLKGSLYLSWSDTQIEVQVPAGTKSGKLYVLVNKTKSNTANFTLLEGFETVTIGTQVWMKKNLNVECYRNGDTIPQIKDSLQWSNLTTGAWCYYNYKDKNNYNDKKNSAVYGKYYNWHAVNDPRGLAPGGWHVPDEYEWQTLVNFLGGESVAGGKMKEEGLAHWKNPNDASNSSDFSALPGGGQDFYGAVFEFIGSSSYLWSSTKYEFGELYAWRIGLFNYNTKIENIKVKKITASSVRCIKDKPPTIESIYPTYSKIGDEINIYGTWFGSSQGLSSVTFAGINAVNYTSWSKDCIKVLVPKGVTSGNVTVAVTVYGQKSNDFDFTIVPDSCSLTIKTVEPTSVYIGDIVTIKGTGFGSIQGQSYVIFNNIKAIIYSNWNDTQIEVKVPIGSTSGKLSVIINGTKSKEIDYTILGEFETVNIGSQVWMKKNLEVDKYRNGDTIPQVTDIEQWKNLTTGAWCYFGNKPEYGAIYGKLYNWYAVNDPRGLAPESWHVASDAEWQLLSDYLGGDSISGGKLKEAGTSHWRNPNTGATNSSGFTALPGGERVGTETGEQFADIYLESAGFWWTSTEYDSAQANCHWLKFQNTDLTNNWLTTSWYKISGFSVRCIQD